MVVHQNLALAHSNGEQHTVFNMVVNIIISMVISMVHAKRMVIMYVIYDYVMCE
jgi:hypothetical protein